MRPRHLGRGNLTIKHAVREFANRVLKHKHFYLIKRDAEVGFDPFEDMARFTSKPEPMLFDIGANIGQTVHKFRATFPRGQIHSFEPGQAAFRRLRDNCAKLSNVDLWNCAVGSIPAQSTFHENSSLDMSSFLSLRKSGWGTVEKTSVVDVICLDDFVSERGIDFIDVLKSDTQGFEAEVFKGAERLLNEGKIGLVYFELILSDMYEGLPGIDELFRFLLARNYRLVSIYDIHHQGDLVGWMDVLFVQLDLYLARNTMRHSRPST